MIAVCAVLLAIGFAIAFGVLAANIASCNVSSRNGKRKKKKSSSKFRSQFILLLLIVKRFF